MIEVTRVTEEVIEVKQVLMSWSKTDVSFVYFDIKNWKKSDVYEISTDSPVMVYDMVEEGIKWVEMFYLPKIRNKEGEQM